MRLKAVATTLICFITTAFAQHSDALKFKGIRIREYGNATIIVVALSNVSAAPIKAFRANLLKSNDFNEATKVAAIEYSSESEFRSSGGRTAGHVIKPGETLFYTITENKNGTGEMFFTNDVGDLEPSSTGQFSLEVSRVVNAE